MIDPMKPRMRRLFWSNRDGSPAVEFAFIAPVLLAMLMGIISYGCYFWTAHTVQQLANDAARAAIAGLTDSERTELARSTLHTDLAGQPGMDPRKIRLDVARQNTTLTVRVGYDGGSTIFAALGQIAPMPDPQIERTASVRLGGF